MKSRPPAQAQLHRLVYFSRTRGRPTACASAIRAILTVSQVNNARVGITGALMFNSGVFAQVLEGDLAAVETTFERIQRDVRHGDVEVLAFGPAAERAFPSWSMGFVGQSRADRDVFAEIGARTGFDVGRFTGERVLETLKVIALDEEQVRAA